MTTPHRLRRRDALKQFALLAAVGSMPAQGADAAGPAPAPFQLPPLPYPVDALEPHLDARTMEIHHGKHHATYVANLNKALAGAPALAGRSIEELLTRLESLPDPVRTAVRNNGGGHYNHTLFWQMMARDAGGTPGGEVGAALDRTFGGFAGFKDEFTKAALGQFGSGWAWLCWDPVGRALNVRATPNQDSPLSQGLVPLLGIDVWEHAYYLKYQNRRADYVAAFFNVVRWDFVAERLAAARK